MRIRAIASATTRSNAVGVVEVDCTPHGLLLGFLGVGSFAEGYAPAALASGVQLTVPWSALKTARADGDQVYLELDWPGLPHDRLTLTRFSLGHRPHPLELRRQRLIVQLGAVAAAALASVIAAAVVPRLTVRATAAVTFSIGLLAALGVLALGFLIDQRLLSGPVQEGAVRSAFLAELESYFPALVRTAVAPKARPSKRKVPNLAGFLPRSAAAVAITLAGGIIAAVGTTRHLLRPPESALARGPQVEVAPALAAPPEETHLAAPAGGSSVPHVPPPNTQLAPPTTDALASLGRCACKRASSPLWEQPIPTLSVLLLEVSRVDRRSGPRTQLEIAVVNNGKTALEEITVRALFFDGAGKQRQELAQRPLYFEGPLAPGRAIKWRTEAKGSHFELETPHFGHLDLDGSNAASTEAFRELLNANHRPVRLHAARMLAFLGDKTAAQATLQLKDALRSAEAPYLRRLMAALADIRVCDLKVSGEGRERRAEACVYNATDQDRDQIGVQLVALDRALTPDRPLAAPPTLLADRKWLLPEVLPAHFGMVIRVSADLAGAEEAVTFEMHADRFDLLD